MDQVDISACKAENTLEAEASWGVARHPRHAAPRTEEYFFSFCKTRHVLSILRMRGKFIGLASLWSTSNQWLGLRQPLRHVLVRCAIYTSRREAATPHLGFPLPQVYSRLNTTLIFQDCHLFSGMIFPDFSRFAKAITSILLDHFCT